MTHPNFAGKNVIVTGASSGIGRALALQLAGQGACLILASRDADRLNILAVECRRLGTVAEAIPTDVSDETQCRNLIDQALAHLGSLDILINNAGIGVSGLFSDLPDLNLFNQVMQVNFMGAVFCTYHALPYLKQARGQIVNISSVAAITALPYNTSYVASKTALNGFSDTLRLELAESGVSVTVAMPYWVITEFHERLLDRFGVAHGASGRKFHTRQTMSADQCARIILHAAARRKRQVVFWPGSGAQWLKLLFPTLLDQVVCNIFMRRARQRIKHSK